MKRFEPNSRGVRLLPLFANCVLAACQTAPPERVTSVTAAEIGSRLAILVDSEVRSVPVIGSEIRGPRAGLMIPATESEAERLATLVRARWPLAPLVSDGATSDLEEMSIESHTAPLRMIRHPDV